MTSRTGKKISTTVVENTIIPEERRQMIAESAYFRAEQRDFQGGNPEQDWFESEVEIDNVLAP